MGKPMVLNLQGNETIQKIHSENQALSSKLKMKSKVIKQQEKVGLLHVLVE